MQKILVPVSKDIPQDKILQHIKLFGNSNNTTIILFRSVPMPDSAGYMHNDDNPANTINMVRQDNIGELGELEEELKLLGYRTEIFVMVGDLEEDLVQLINQIKPSLLLMLTEGAQNIWEDMFGTNTSNIIGQTKVPVFVAHYNRLNISIKKTVVGLPLEISELQHVKQYFELAETLKLDSGYIKIDKEFEMDHVENEEFLNNMNHLYPGKINNIVYRQYDDIAEGLEKYATEVNADLIVLFATQKYLIEKIFKPSVTQSLIKHCKIPLLIYHC